MSSTPLPRARPESREDGFLELRVDVGVHLLHRGPLCSTPVAVGRHVMRRTDAAPMAPVREC